LPTPSYVLPFEDRQYRCNESALPLTQDIGLPIADRNMDNAVRRVSTCRDPSVHAS
jgi:hypothetical protein